MTASPEFMPAAPDLVPPRRVAWRLAVTWYSYLVTGYFTFLASVQGNVLPFLRAEFDLSYGVASLHSSAIAAGMLVVGIVGDRFVWALGRGRVLRAGLAGSLAGAVLVCLAPAAWASIASCFVIGFFGCHLTMTSAALLSDIHHDRRAIALAEANVMAYVFAIMAPILTGLGVWLGLNWRVALLVGAASGFVILVAFYRTPVPDSRVLRATVAGHALPAGFWGYWAALGLGVATEFSVLLWAPTYLHDVVGLDASAAATGAAAFFAAMLVGRSAGTGLLRFIPGREMFFGSAAVTLAGFAIYWSGTAPLVAIAGLFILGLGIAMFFPLIISVGLGVAGDAADRASTRLVIGPALAILLCPPLLGSIADHAGLWVAQSMTAILTVLTVAAYVTGEILMRTTTARPA